MALVEQPAQVLAPSSDAGEGLRYQGSTHSTIPSQLADGIEEASRRDAHGSGRRGLPTSTPIKEAGRDTQGAGSNGHAPIVYKELAPLVAMPPPSDAAVHNRLARYSYSRLGRNLLFEARPAVRQL